MKKILAIAISYTFLSACGGGSEGASGIYPSAASYDLLQLRAGNANDSVSVSFQGLTAGTDSAEGLELDSGAEAGSSILALAQSYAGEYVGSSSIQSRAGTESGSEACTVSGSVEAQLQGDLSNSGDWLQINFDNCTEDGSTINGGLRIEVLANSTNASDIRATFSSYKVTEGLQFSTLDGDFRMAWLRNGAEQRNTISSSRLNAVSSESGNTVIAGLNLQAVEDMDSGESTLEIAYDLASDELNGRLVFSTPELMRYTSLASNPSTGVFKIAGAGGSSVSLDANTGDLATVMFTLFDGSTTTSEEVSWASIENSDLAKIADY